MYPVNGSELISKFKTILTLMPAKLLQVNFFIPANAWCTGFDHLDQGHFVVLVDKIRVSNIFSLIQGSARRNTGERISTRDLRMENWRVSVALFRTFPVTL